MRTKLPFVVAFRPYTPFILSDPSPPDLGRVEEGRLLKNGALYVDLASVEQLDVSHLVDSDSAHIRWHITLRGAGFEKAIVCSRSRRQARDAQYPALELHLLDELARLRPDIPVGTRRTATDSFMRVISAIRRSDSDRSDTGPPSLGAWWAENWGTSAIPRGMDSKTQKRVAEGLVASMKSPRAQAVDDPDRQATAPTNAAPLLVQDEFWEEDTAHIERELDRIRQLRQAPQSFDESN